MHGLGLPMMFPMKSLKLKNFVQNLLQNKIMKNSKKNFKKLVSITQIFLPSLKVNKKKKINNLKLKRKNNDEGLVYLNSLLFTYFFI
jgi:hypothetical protein